MILCFCRPSNPRRLWDQFSDALSDDLMYKDKQSGLYPADDPQAQFDARDNALFHIINLLIDMETNLDKYLTLPRHMDNAVINYPWSNNSDHERSHHEPTSQEYAQLASTHMTQVTAEQKAIFNTIPQSLNPKRNDFASSTAPVARERAFCTTRLLNTYADTRKSQLSWLLHRASLPSFYIKDIHHIRHSTSYLPHRQHNTFPNKKNCAWTSLCSPVKMLLPQWFKCSSSTRPGP